MKERDQFCLFVGESPSPTALRNDWTWESQHLAGKTLAEALEAVGLVYGEQLFVNLYDLERNEVSPEAVSQIEAAVLAGFPVVAMGKRVAAGLEELGLNPDAKIIHPAARGRIRGSNRYAEHVAEQLACLW